MLLFLIIVIVLISGEETKRGKTFCGFFNPVRSLTELDTVFKNLSLGDPRLSSYTFKIIKIHLKIFEYYS